MNDYIKIELRKNRWLFICMAGLFALSLPLTLAVTAWKGIPAQTGLNAALVFWNLAGLPLLALLFGANSGASLRMEPVRSAEIPLPLSPRRRIFASLSASYVHLLLLALLFILTLIVLSPDWIEFIAQNFTGEMSRWAGPNPDFPLIRLSLASAGYLALASFICAYALSHGIIGGILGLFLGALFLVPLYLGFGLQVFFSEMVSFTKPGLSACVGTFLLAFWALFETVPWVERRADPGWLKGAAIALALIAGGFLSLGALAFSREDLLNHVWVISDMDGYYRHRLEPVVLNHFPEVRKARSGGVVVMDHGGGLHLVSPGRGDITLVEGEERTIRDLFKSPIWKERKEIAWDKDGSLWILDRLGGYPTAKYVLLHGKPGGRFRIHTRFSVADWFYDPFVWKGDELGLMTHGGKDEGYRIRYAPIPERGKQPRWEDTGQADPTAYLARGFERMGLVAKSGKDMRTLRGRGSVWKLPGFAVDSQTTGHGYFSVSVGGKELFLVPVALSDEKDPPAKNPLVYGDKALAVCYPGGKVRTVWRGGPKSSYEFHVLPDGTQWSWRDRGTLLVMTPGGDFLPPMDLRTQLGALNMSFPKLYSLPVVAHREGDFLWLVARNTFLLKYDRASQRVLKKWQIDGFQKEDDEHWMYRECYVQQDGFYYQSSSKLYFVDWEGRKVRVTPF